MVTFDNILSNYNSVKDIEEEINDSRRERNAYRIGMFPRNEEMVTMLENNIDKYNQMVDSFNITIHNILLNIDKKLRSMFLTPTDEKSFLDWYETYYQYHALTRK